MELTKEEIINEIKKCQEDPIYFINNYILIEHPLRGLVPFHLYAFQQRILNEVKDHRFNVIRKFRQAGVTTLCAAYSLWSIIFNEHHNIMVVSIGDRESTAFLRRVTLMYDDLPLWLKPGIQEKNKHNLHLTTNSRIRSQPAGAGRGEAVSHLIVDEAAFIPEMREFWTAIFPTISTGGKVTMLSTVNGMSNVFYEIYREATERNNSFNVVDIHWREHPDYTEKWAEETKPNIGERAWLQEYECSFLGTGDTFIDHSTLGRLRGSTNDNYRETYRKRMRVWEDPKPYANYLISVDSSYGREKDYSAFHVLDLYNGTQVAEFYSNKTSLRDFAEIIKEEGYKYNTANIVIERNGLGLALIEKLFEELEYENLWMDDKSEFGMLITAKSKEAVLASLEDCLRTSKVKINSERTVSELLTFIITENGKIEADDGYNDDLALSLAVACHTMGDILDSTPMMPHVGDEKSNTKDEYIIPIKTSRYDDDSEDLRWVIE
jgi:hypothetical protein